MSHSYMFLGINNEEKIIKSKNFAEELLKSSIENNPDYYFIEPDGNSIKIEQIRTMIQKIIEKPVKSNKKVYIINKAETMTKEAQNSLLKTLEEPPEYVVIILLVENENLILNTVKSRCEKKIISSIEVEIKENEEINTFFENIEDKTLLELFEKIDVIKEKENIIKNLEYIVFILSKKVHINKQYINCIEIVEKSKKDLSYNANIEMVIDNMVIDIFNQFN